MQRKILSGLLLMAAVVGLSLQTQAVQAQNNYPSQPVRVLIGFAAGGPTDVIGRILAQHMTQSMGQTVLVENRTGAN